MFKRQNFNVENVYLRTEYNINFENRLLKIFIILISILKKILFCILCQLLRFMNNIMLFYIILFCLNAVYEYNCSIQFIKIHIFMYLELLVCYKLFKLKYA